MVSGSGFLLVILTFALLFCLIYMSAAYPHHTPIPSNLGISQEQAINIADNDLRDHLDRYDGILKIIVNNTSGYVAIEEIKSKNMTLPLVYVSQSGYLISLKKGANQSLLAQNNLGYCTEPLYAYCGFLPNFNFDYKGKVVYGVEVLASYNDSYGVPFLYIIDAEKGNIVDSTFLRNERISQMTNGR